MQSDFPHLERAPIREAVLDIKVEPRQGLRSEDLAAFVEAVQADFPETRPIQSLHAALNMQGDAPEFRSSPLEVVGTICWNRTKTRAVQGRVDGFTVNHVQGYESWEVLREQARDLWRQYVDIAKPTRVTRCALRYINRLELPVLADMAANLLTRPEVGPDLPQLVDDFFLRVVLPFANGRKASISQASESLGEPSATAREVILDIDAFSTTPFEVGDDAVWREFDQLRAIKNTCFFGSLNKTVWKDLQ